MSQIQYIEIKNNGAPLELEGLPGLSYPDFFDLVAGLLEDESKRCVSYFAVPEKDKFRFICILADDTTHNLVVLSHKLDRKAANLRSLAAELNQLHIFEREIHENYGIGFEGHPFLKPVRYAYDRADRSKIMDNYPFYQISGEELHEVGVGPVHAGIIEPGHFRFICNGEKVLHLEIHLGYQHRGIEKLFAAGKPGLHRSILSENIAGDTAIGHSLAYVQCIESLAGVETADALQVERCIALELERIAVHMGDMAALCADVAYQFGQVVCEALRTTIINTTQAWCGNRFGKGLVRPAGSHYPLGTELAGQILNVLADSGRRFSEMTEALFTTPSVLSRFDGTGPVTRLQAVRIGAVGMAARSSGLSRDTRSTQPFQYYRQLQVTPSVLDTGDVLARAMLRKLEVQQSIGIIHSLIEVWQLLEKVPKPPVYDLKLRSGCLAVSITEGWRGEICHVALTNEQGRIFHYKVKDPSIHNWMALALAVRNQEISDFPVCNKSFNLSYCGFDL